MTAPGEAGNGSDMSNTPQKHQSVLQMFDLTGRVAVVTGGAGLYGRQIVEALAEAGARTIMASRNLANLLAEAERLRQVGLRVETLQYDQADEQSVLQLLQQVVDTAGGVDILVNNAVLRPMHSWLAPADDFAESMAVNATGLLTITRAFGEHMADRGRGSIINVSSIYGTVGPDFTLYEETDMDAPPDYFFHKGGLLQLTRYVASRLGPRGVRVNAISPGGFFTDQNPQFVKRYNARTLLERMASSTDLKGVIVFLASDASAYVTGANIAVDGGFTAK
jgi:NAD(P)-dependent dehydrogenase (short-subunit alcohol dehydrogenase family)